jgi:hypothetical protein
MKVAVGRCFFSFSFVLYHGKRRGHGKGWSWAAGGLWEEGKRSLFCPVFCHAGRLAYDSVIPPGCFL